MGESTSQIEWDIAAERNELGRNLKELEDKAKALADWRTYYRNHPFAMLGLALGGGMVLGALTRRRMRGPEGSAYREPNQFRSASSPLSATSRVRREVGDTWDHVTDALLGVATARAIEFVSGLVPGFRDQYLARHPEHRMPFSSDRIRET